MKKIVLVATIAFVLAGSLEARNGGHSHYYYERGGHGGWIVPFIFGSMIGYTISRQPVVYAPSPAVVYTDSPTVIVDDQYTLQNDQYSVQEDQSPVYEERWVYFEDCQCERKVLVNIRQ